VNWRVLDDAAFVHLVADLLARLGFVDIRVGGEAGTDGGIDLIATELITSHFQGPRPLKWGIQCKFSKAGQRSCVGNRQIGDVVGVLCSERNLVHKLNGYLLIANQRISHTLVERLRGLDRTTGYRVDCVHGEQLENHLNGNPDILGTYMSRVVAQIEALASESAQERAMELSGTGELRFAAGGPRHLDAGRSVLELDISGSYASDTGQLELDHDPITGQLEGRYQWNSDRFVAELAGSLHDGILCYEFQWLQEPTHGCGLYFISASGRRLEGAWLLGGGLQDVSLRDLLDRGQRKSYRRVG
jgi:hypothetical protein